MKMIFCVLFLFVVSCSAQNIPVAVTGAFTKTFPGITVKKWDKENKNYEANFSKDGKPMSATFNAAGILIETEKGIQVSDLPAVVVDYVKSNYKGAVIKEAAIIGNASSSKIYEAEVKGKDLLFHENGKFLKEEED